MTARLRERIGSIGIGRITNVSANVATGVTATVDIAPGSGFDYVIGTLISFGGISQNGPVTWECSNGAQAFSGFATDVPQDIFVPSPNSIRLQVINNLPGTISYNILLIMLTRGEYDAYIRGRF